MEKQYKKLSNDVISCGKQMFAKVYSAETFNRKIYEDEVEYGTIFKDISIQLEGIVVADAILTTLVRDNGDSASFIDIISCDLLGTFVSDWY